MKTTALIFLLAFLLAGTAGSFAQAQKTPDAAISIKLISDLFPTASRVVPVQSPVPHSIAFEGTHIIGYAFYSDLIAPIPAYSGKPIRSLISINADRTFRSVKIVKHEEPILVIGIDDQALATFLLQYKGLSAVERIRISGAGQPNSIDGISGASITTMVLNRSIQLATQQVLQAHASTTDAAFKQRTVDSQPYWLAAWSEKKVELVFLGIGLTILVFILLFQDWVVTKPWLFSRLRIGFLLYTVFFIGYYCLGQLSLINVVTFVHLLTSGFTWETLLLDPVIFVLWGFVAMSILLWGRGVFCGWLCPFGAIQELMHKLAQFIKIRPIEVPGMVHERLLAIKYIILVVLAGLALNSVTTAAPFIEIEPFKTAISLRFQREWYFVIYPVAAIAISIFTTKFYCRYICPLGALLSFTTRFKIFDWLRRRPECGAVCHTCANDCSVRAVNNKGEINEAECHYCLHCQTTFWDEHRCPVMVSKRERRERRENRHTEIPVKRIAG